MSSSGSFGSVTYSPDGASATKRVCLIKDGRIVSPNLNEATMYSSLRNKHHKHPLTHVVKTHGFSIIKPKGLKTHGKRQVIKGPVHLDIEMERGEMTLDEYIRHSASNDEIARNMWWIFVDLIHSVWTLHKQGITHNDLKPANIVINSNHKIRLIDMGAARRTKHGGYVMCTYPFSAPEALIGAPPSPITDAFSVGAVGLFCMTGGKYLYDFSKYKTPDEVYAIHAAGRLNIPRDCPTGHFKFLFDIVRGMLHPNPALRFGVKDTYMMMANFFSFGPDEPVALDFADEKSDMPGMPGMSGMPGKQLSWRRMVDRAMGIDDLYVMSGLSTGTATHPESFPLAVNLLDRFEAIVGRSSVFEERFVFCALAVATLKPDVKVEAVYTETMLAVLETLNFHVYSDTCRDVLIEEYGVEAGDVDYRMMRDALKAVYKDSRGAAELYLKLKAVVV